MNIKLRKTLIVFSIRFLGFIGLELFSLSERIVNIRNTKFFNKFTSGSKESNKQEFILDYDFIKKTISKRFKKNKLDIEVIELLSKLFVSRVEGNKIDISISQKKLIIEGIINNELLELVDLFLLSKFFSKLGVFSVAEGIESHTLTNLEDGNSWSTVYELFQIIKLKLFKDYNESLRLVTKFNLLRFMQKKYNFDDFQFLFTAKEVNPNYLILGPLRAEILDEEMDLNICMIIKPTETEMIRISSRPLINKLFLYTIRKLRIDYLDLRNVINVVEYHDKHKGIVKIKHNLNFLLINGFPQHLQRLLLHQITDIKNHRFKIDYFSFHLSDVIYPPNHSSPEKILAELSNKQIHQKLWRDGWHDLLSNFRFSKYLYLANVISTTSDSLNEILQMNQETYAVKLEKLYTFK